MIGPLADVEGHQQLSHRIDRHPDPVGERDKRLIALASVISPSLTALSTAYSSSSCSCLTCRSQKKRRQRS